mgnify:FL=1
MTSLETLLKEGTKVLEQHKIQEARLDAWLLLEYVTGMNRAFYFAHSADGIEEEKADRYRELIRKRAAHVPLQHITHQAYFMGFEFYVNQNVLVPRQDTETLVEKALEVMKGKKTPGILDMCTGSGCILLSLLALTGDAYGVGADVSPLALQVANKNAVSLEVSDRAVFVESDLFSSAFFQQNTGKDMPQYDILISNPPYIRSAEIEELMEELKKYPAEDVYCIGGDTIYKQLLPYCDAAQVTKIDFAYIADSYFPNLDEDPQWHVAAESEEQTYFDLEYKFVRYERNK